MQQQVQLARSSSEITLRGSVELVAEFFGFAINSILYQRGVYPADTFVSVAKYGLSTQVTADEGLKTYLASVVRQLAGWLAVGAVKKLVVVIAGAEASAGCAASAGRPAAAAAAAHCERPPPTVFPPRGPLLPAPRPRRRARRSSDGCFTSRRTRRRLRRGACLAAPPPLPPPPPPRPPATPRLLTPAPILRRSAAPRVKPAKEIQGEIQAIIRQITASVTFLPLLEEPCTFDLLVYADEAAAVPKAWEESDPRYVASGSTEVRLRSFTTTIHAVSATVVYKAS